MHTRPPSRPSVFSDGVELALRTALEAHEGQLRKGLEAVPYVVHPVHVAFMLARFCADDHVVQAAILHDVVEDCEGWTIARIEQDFGQRVSSIVAELTEDKSKSWDERKRAAVDEVPHISDEAALIKVHVHNVVADVFDPA